MSLRLAFEQLADLQRDVQRSVERAGDQEDRLEALVAATEGDVRHAEVAVSRAGHHVDVDELRHQLSAQLERSAAGAAGARRLLAGAHQQRCRPDKAGNSRGRARNGSTGGQSVARLCSMLFSRAQNPIERRSRSTWVARQISLTSWSASMQSVGITAPHNMVASSAVEDEDAASRSVSRLLITSPTREGVESLARRVHLAGLRAELPFVQTRACDLPIEAGALRERCCTLLDAAAGGSLLIADIEDMSPVVQDVLIEVFAWLERSRSPSAAVRLISGTTESLRNRVIAGTFSERLFYRLNIIHLMVGNGSEAAVI
jgi:transcriptional regulator of acetoin/glycerol metabolism